MPFAKTGKSSNIRPEDFDMWNNFKNTVKSVVEEGCSLELEAELRITRGKETSRIPCRTVTISRNDIVLDISYCGGLICEERSVTVCIAWPPIIKNIPPRRLVVSGSAVPLGMSGLAKVSFNAYRFE